VPHFAVLTMLLLQRIVSSDLLLFRVAELGFVVKLHAPIIDDAC